MAAANGSPIGNDFAVGVGEWWRGDGDALQLSEKVAAMGWLVVAHRLPHHALTVLVVVPEGVVAVVCLQISSVHAYIFIICSAHDDFLAPVADDVAHGRGSVLRPVAVGGAVGGKDGRAVCLEHTGGSLTRAGSVETFLQQVAVPVDAPVVGEAGRAASDDLVGYARDGARLAAVANGSGIGIGEVTAKGAAVITRRLQTVIDFRRGGVAVVHGWLVLVAGKDFLSVTVGVEV